MSFKKKILLTFLLLFVLVIAAIGGYALFMITYMTRNSLNPEELKINSQLDTQVVNIALFGIDGRDDVEVEGDRTDSILIGTLDLRDNSVKVTSIMRDTFAKICYATPSGRKEDTDTDSEDQTDTDSQDQADTDKDQKDNIKDTTEVTLVGEDNEEVVIDYENRDSVAEYTKINAAYSEGGVESSIATINQNFDLNIQDYITVDFNCLMDIVDAVGGVELNIPNEDVRYWTNEYLKESNGWGHRNDPEIESTGVQTLTGAQALAFARNRYSDSDFGRSQRQREVVQAIFNKVKQQDTVSILNLAAKLYPYVQTSLSLSEITQYASAVLNAKDLQFEHFQVPTNKYGTAGFIDGEWFLFPDTLVKNCISLHKFLYGPNTDYVPSERVKQISAVIDYDLDEYAYDKYEQIGGPDDSNFAPTTDTTNKDTSAETDNTSQDAEDTNEDTVTNDAGESAGIE